MGVLISGGMTPVVAQPAPAPVAKAPGVAPVAAVQLAQGERPIAYGVQENAQVQEARKDRRRGRHDDPQGGEAREDDTPAADDGDGVRGQNVDTSA